MNEEFPYGYYTRDYLDSVEDLNNKIKRKIERREKLSPAENEYYKELKHSNHEMDDNYKYAEKLREKYDSYDEYTKSKDYYNPEFDEIKKDYRLYVKGVALKLIPSIKDDRGSGYSKFAKKERGKDLKNRLYYDSDSIKKREKRAEKPAFPSFRKSKAKPKPKKAKSTFRSGDSQGKSMIRNMNRMTGTTLRRFQK